MALDDYVKRDEKLKNGTMTRRDFLNLAGKAGVAGAGVAILGKCAGPTDPDPPGTDYAHKFMGQAQTLHTDSAVTGTIEVTMRSNGQKYTGPIGQVINLATTKTKTELCDILIQANSCLPREYTEVGITDNTLNTKIVQMNAIDWNGVVYIMPDGINRSWTPRKFDVYFNPDPLTGLRLDNIYIDPIEQALLYIQQNSKGWIQSVNFYELGTKPHDSSVPPEGEIWVYRASDYPGVSNITYPSSYVKVTSSKIFVNQDSSMPAQLPAETYDALFGAGQEFGSDPSFIGPFFMLMLNIPRDTNNHVINPQKQTQKGIDSQTSFQSYEQAKFF
jgi:hypothetical protein